MKSYVYAILVAIIVSIGGCISSTNGPIQEVQSTQKTTAIYIDSLPFGVDSKYANSIREAMSFWEKNLPSANFKEVSSQKDADVIVKWVKEFGGRSLGHTVYSDFIEIGLGDSFCLEKWKPYDYDTVLLIAKHELGHALGGEDQYDDPKKIMYYQISTKYGTDIEESEVIPDGWSRFYPVCTKNSVALYSIDVTSSEPLNIYVVPSRQDYELFSKDQTFSNYANCRGNEVEFYTRTCTVSKGGGIILNNPTTFGLGSDAKFTIKVEEI